jgi:hypothetical protein
VTSTTAVLNGFVAPTQPSAWLFQYGLTKSYGTNTKPQYVAAGSAVPVSWQITGLTPNTLYHYRLVVIEGTYSQHAVAGDDLTFATAAPGTKPPPGSKNAKASLKSHFLVVHNGSVSIPLKCSGASGASCAGTVTLTGHTKAGKPIGCGGGSFSIAAGQSKSVNSGVGKRCRARLRAAKGHKIGADLKATFTTHQGTLRTGVTLVRG